MNVDITVIGGGFAGTAAAITLARARRTVALIDSGQPRNRFSEHAHGILGLDSVSPLALLKKGHEEFGVFGGELITGYAESVIRSSSDSGRWNTSVNTRGEITSKHVLVATGITDRLPNIDGLKDLWGEDVFHCPYCHGFEASGKNVAVIGGTNPAFTCRLAKLLTKWTNEVTFYVNGLEISESDLQQFQFLGVSLVHDPVISVFKGDKGSGNITVRTDESEKLHATCFTGPDFLPNDGLLRTLGCEFDGAWVRSHNGSTSKEGIWVAGNVCSSPDQIPQAQGSGVATAIRIDQALFDEQLSALM